jgi:hypothetical protein
MGSKSYFLEFLFMEISNTDRARQALLSLKSGIFEKMPLYFFDLQ